LFDDRDLFDRIEDSAN